MGHPPGLPRKQIPGEMPVNGKCDIVQYSQFHQNLSLQIAIRFCNEKINKCGEVKLIFESHSLHTARKKLVRKASYN